MKSKIQLFLIFFLSVCLFYSVSINLNQFELNESDYKSNIPKSDFELRNNLSGVIIKSNDKSEIGSVITISDFNSPNPKMIFESGRTSPLTKFCESKKMLTIGIIADATCSSDIFLINKENGNFVRTQSGSIGGLSGTVSKGYFK